MEKTLNDFVMYVLKNWSHTKGGYSHKGDFYKNDKLCSLESLKDQFLKEKQLKTIHHDSRRNIK